MTLSIIHVQAESSKPFFTHYHHLQAPQCSPFSLHASLSLGMHSAYLMACFPLYMFSSRSHWIPCGFYDKAIPRAAQCNAVHLILRPFNLQVYGCYWLELMLWKFKQALIEHSPNAFICMLCVLCCTMLWALMTSWKTKCSRLKTHHKSAYLIWFWQLLSWDCHWNLSVHEWMSCTVS